VIGAEVGCRSDLFAVGSMLYELVTGRRPFNADNLMAIFYNITHQEPDESLIPQGPQWERLRGVIRRALQRKPDDRYPDAGAMSTDLVLALEALGGDVEWKARPSPVAPARAFRFETRSPVTRRSMAQPGVSAGIRTARAFLAAVVRRIRAFVRGV
jgi:serine/threonine-protein kinase